MINILLTAAGSPVFIPAFKSLRANPNLKDLKIHTCDMNTEALGLKIADAFFYVPPGNSTEYIPAVYSYCKENQIDLIIPAADEELSQLSQNKEMFLNIGCKILVSSSHTLKTIQNKASLYNACRRSLSLPEIIPEFRVCNDLSSFKHHYDKIRSLGHKVCVKPAFAHGSRGFRVIEDLPSKADFFNKKSNSRSITYDFFCSILAQDKDPIPDLLVMEYLPGEEFSVDCLAKDGKFYCVTRRRDTIVDGICSVGTVIKKLDLIEKAQNLYERLDLQYNANIQFRYDAGGNPKLLEINPRVAGTMELCRGAGVDFVGLAVNQALDFEEISNISVEWGTTMNRVWQEIFHAENNIFTLESIASVVSSKNNLK